MGVGDIHAHRNAACQISFFAVLTRPKGTRFQTEMVRLSLAALSAAAAAAAGPEQVRRKEKK